MRDVIEAPFFALAEKFASHGSIAENIEMNAAVIAEMSRGSQQQKQILFFSHVARVHDSECSWPHKLVAERPALFASWGKFLDIDRIRDDFDFSRAASRPRDTRPHPLAQRVHRMRQTVIGPSQPA